jgi:hypothetical protein
MPITPERRMISATITGVEGTMECHGPGTSCSSGSEEVAMLRMLEKPKGKCIAVPVMRDVQGSTSMKLAMFQRERTSGGSGGNGEVAELHAASVRNGQAKSDEVRRLLNGPQWKWQFSLMSSSQALKLYPM